MISAHARWKSNPTSSKNFFEKFNLTEENTKRQTPKLFVFSLGESHLIQLDSQTSQLKSSYSTTSSFPVLLESNWRFTTERTKVRCSQFSHTILPTQNRSSTQFSPAKTETENNASDFAFSAEAMESILLVSGTIVAALSAPLMCYKLITTPSPIYEQDPRLWRNLVLLCIGLTVAGGYRIQHETERAYQNSLHV